MIDSDQSSLPFRTMHLLKWFPVWIRELQSHIWRQGSKLDVHEVLEILWAVQKFLRDQVVSLRTNIWTSIAKLYFTEPPLTWKLYNVPLGINKDDGTLTAVDLAVRCVGWREKISSWTTKNKPKTKKRLPTLPSTRALLYVSGAHRTWY